MAPLPLLLLVGLEIMVFIGCFLNIQRWRQQGVQFLGWRNGSWWLEKDQAAGEVELESYLLLPGILQLVFRREGQRHRVLVYPDSVSRDERRHLRQLLTLCSISFS